MAVACLIESLNLSPASIAINHHTDVLGQICSYQVAL
jgi:hypothetical protein